MTSAAHPSVEAAWSRVKKTYVDYLSSAKGADEIREALLDEHKAALKEFLAHGEDAVMLLKRALRRSDRDIAILMLERVHDSELEKLFDELVFLASFSHGAIQRVRDAIIRLPQHWVLSQIEDVAERLLANGTYDEYRRLLELYVLVDASLTQRLAARAVGDSDPDIREAGRDFLEKGDPS